MEDYKNIINYLIDNSEASIKDVVDQFPEAMKGLNKGHYYGIQYIETGYVLTYMNEGDNDDIYRYDIKICKEIKK